MDQLVLGRGFAENNIIDSLCRVHKGVPVCYKASSPGYSYYDGCLTKIRLQEVRRCEDASVDSHLSSPGKRKLSLSGRRSFGKARLAR